MTFELYGYALLFGEAILTSTHNLCFEQKYETSENFHFLVVKFSIYLNRRVFVMICSDLWQTLEECIM